MKKVFVFLVLVALYIVYFLVGQAELFDGIAKTFGYEGTYHYAVIIDAGSSGSRVLAYKFRMPYTVFGQSNLDLVDEYFEESKPGLSSYVDDPAKGADTILQLIKKAETIIPADKKHEAPVLVRATAGLRLLPQDKATRLITYVREAVEKSGYDVSGNPVEIMDGSDEGIFIWYTINLLHNLMYDDTMVALDLGGGSTQITYQLNDDEKRTMPKSDQFVVPLGGSNITVYTHSYLNLGLLAARYGILRLEANDNETSRFSSVCVEPIVQDEKWTYANKQYYISGASRPLEQKREVSFELCHALVKRYVLATLDWEPTSPPRGALAAMSYFYDVAADAGIIDVMEGGSVSISSYRNYAVQACSAANVEQPWACIDLIYIMTLLRDAYKMHPDTPLSLYKKVNGHEVSWALGLAYKTVTSRIPPQ